MAEIDLLANYPRAKRNVEERGQTKTEADRAIARRFDKEFFDGDRSHLAQMIPRIVVKGIDISQYAVENAIEDMRPHVQVADAAKLPFPDKSFDVVISVNTIHNLPRDLCGQALREIERVARRGAFITVDAYRNDAERQRMEAWNLTAKTIMRVDEWKAFFNEVGYTGDYYWFIP
jgi:ubiquinone/menaquinone biosynthesis C-methylase UbiE